jgi:hypothetical protein
MLGVPDLGFVPQGDCFESVVFNEKMEMTERYVVPVGKKNIFEMFEQKFPEEIDGIRDLFNVCENISVDLLKLKRLIRENPLKHPLDAISALFLSKGRDGSVFKKMALKNTEI